MIQKKFIKYPSITSHLKSEKDNKHTLVIEPLLPGYGFTLGNSLRRVFLSSIPGFAVTRIKIKDITHEYQAIEGITEDAMNLILNLKLIRAKILNDEPKVTISLHKNKSGEIKAGDFESAGKVEIVNKDLYLCTLSKNMDLDIELDITRGVGYLPVEKIDFAGNLNPQDILVDALFSPVSNVALNVEKVRVGDRTDFDRLHLSFQTDGSITAEEAVEFSLDFITELFQQTNSSFLSKQGGSQLTNAASVSPMSKNQEEQMSSELDLPEDIKAILEKNGILTNSDLKEKIEEVNDFSGITKKSLKTIHEYVKTL